MPQPSLYLAKYSADGVKLINVDKTRYSIPSGYSDVSYDAPIDNCSYKIMVFEKDTLTPMCISSFN